MQCGLCVGAFVRQLMSTEAWHEAESKIESQSDSSYASVVDACESDRPVFASIATPRFAVGATLAPSDANESKALASCPSEDARRRQTVGGSRWSVGVVRRSGTP